MRVSRRHSTTVILRATLLITAAAAVGPSVASHVTDASARRTTGIDALVELAPPHVLQGDVAEVIVRVHGSLVCSGTPITGTRLVITAAHCILDHAGDLTAVTVVRDGMQFSPRAVLVDLRYHDAPSPHRDAAVLIMDRAIPGPAAILGDDLPTDGLLTLAGMQPIDTDGTLLRGTSSDDSPTPKGVTGGVVEIASLPTGCVDRASSIDIASDRLTIDCGLVAGASGGGLFVERNGGLVLVGIISTVSVDLSSNGLTPLAAVHELLNHARQYTHASAVERPSAPPGRITQS
jgi:Trypsin